MLEGKDFELIWEAVLVIAGISLFVAFGLGYLVARYIF